MRSNVRRAHPRRARRAKRRCASAAAAPRISTAGARRARCSTRARYAGIVAYEPTELVITARARHAARRDRGGARARSGQMLAFEPPHFGAGATLGGCVAAGLSGPAARRMRARCAISCSACACWTAAARTSRFGGQVMKNVAGYDVSRLMAGSLGTLGVILEVSLKVLPLPAAEATLRFEMPSDKAIEAMNRWARQAAAAISATAHGDGDLARAPVGRGRGGGGGAREARRRAGRRRRGRAFWTGDARADAIRSSRGDEPLWRLSVPSTTPPLALARRAARSSGAARCAGSSGGADAADDPRGGARAPAATRRCSAAATRPAACSSRSRRRCSRCTARLKQAFDPARHPQPAAGMYPDF